MAIRKPYPGLVICYSYLWVRERDSGAAEGLKDRPCAIVAASDDKQILVIPITHTKPSILTQAEEIPEATRKRLGLDDERCWAICSEINAFTWPGYDLRPIPKKGQNSEYAYGMLPPKLFEKIKAKIQLVAQGKKLRVVSRND